MKRIRLLDCTLRDGGYCNNWEFGYENKVRIINGLIESKIDIIECGLLTDKVEYDKNSSCYINISDAENSLLKGANRLYVCLVNYGDYKLENIPNYNGGVIEGIRVAFHKSDMKEALDFCAEIMKKGYKVFVQPMVCLNYSENEYKGLIAKVNTMCPYAFYIVDSFGTMKRKELLKYISLVNTNLNKEICVGFHSHNNMQMAFSNAQTFVDASLEHAVIVDSSIMGMGRGAGNLNTELMIGYLNENFESEYIVEPLLFVIDEVLNSFYERKYWGYSLPNYLSAKHNIHPNYANFFSEKNTLTVEDVNKIFLMIEDDKRVSFDKSYAELLYVQYMEEGEENEEKVQEFADMLEDRKVLIIGPGKSSVDEKEKILAVMQEEGTVSISVNFEYTERNTDFVFLSNLKRNRLESLSQPERLIVTSNIPINNSYLKIKYANYLNDIEHVEDNALLMLIKFLIKIGVENIILAGIDGYSKDSEKNYANDRMKLVTSKETLDGMNSGINYMLNKYSEQCSIKFLTREKYLCIGKENKDET